MHKWLVALVLTALFSSATQSQSNPLWHTQKVKNYLPHMTWPEVEDLLSRTDMVIIPVPAIEQHGLSEAFVDASVQFIERWKVLKPLEPLAERRNY